MPFSSLFVSKHRKLDFSTNITIHDLANVPLVSGLYYIKWKLKNATHASGSTMSSPIRDHDIFWDNILGPCEFKLQVFQEIGGTKDIVLIGSLKVNLSEYANNGLTNRRFLLDDCKFNSTVKLSFRFDQVTETDISYTNPPLKKQQMFTDIPTMIINDRHSLQLNQRSSNAQLKKSQSSSVLPQYCRQVTPFHNTDDPSPTDLVEQLFKTTQ
ncbi:unnamed protein product [Rhizopus stolonifer]